MGGGGEGEGEGEGQREPFPCNPEGPRLLLAWQMSSTMSHSGAWSPALRDPDSALTPQAPRMTTRGIHVTAGYASHNASDYWDAEGVRGMRSTDHLRPGETANPRSPGAVLWPRFHLGPRCCLLFAKGC